MPVASSAIAPVPSVPPTPSGSSAYTTTEKAAEARSALGVSTLASWYSGANAATVSNPYADQPMKYSQVMASPRPPFAPISQVMLSPDQSPVMYGRNISVAAGRISSPPVT